MVRDINRRDMLQGAVALGVLGTSEWARAEDIMATATTAQPAGAAGTIGRYVGAAVPRIDGRAKVSGGAKYAAEFNAPGLLHGSVVTSTIAKGRIKRMDTSKALSVEGVIDVLTHENRPAMADNDKAYNDDAAPAGSPFRPLYADRILFNGQPIALVVAEDSETARFATSLVQVEYEEEPHVTDIFSEREHAVAPKPPANPFEALFATPPARGNADAALAGAKVRHQAEYFVPIEHHNPMELYATTVMWEEGGKLTVYDKTQGVQNVQRYVCSVFDMKPEDVKVMSPFMGGGFGSGLRPQYQTVLAVLAARATKRSVRVVLTRQQLYELGHRPSMIQQIELGGNADGTLAAITHDAITITSQYEEFHRQETGWSALLYACGNAKYAHRLARLDLATSCDMRAPSAASSVYALESAMDELAVALKLDPLELRYKCYSDKDQILDKPYSSKALRDCYRQGADAFGWSRRSPEPRSMREGQDLVGWGMATGVWEALQVPIAVRIVLNAGGQAEVACATSDIGTGTYTIMAQVAADMLGLPIENITVKLGDSTLPRSPVEGGSWIAASVSNGIVTTSNAVCAELLQLAKRMPNSTFAKFEPEAVMLAGGRLANRKNASHAVPIGDIMRHAGLERIEREETTEFAHDGEHAHNTHSAIFAEVKVDEEIGVVRVTRVVSAIAGGRILNAKTAHSQIMGGVVWGIGMALHEETLIDHRFGRIMNANIAEYHVPVHADIGDIQVIFVDERDDIVNPLGIKGLGEIGIVGVAAAVANAVYHATGKRVRHLPITLDKLQS